MSITKIFILHSVSIILVILAQEIVLFDERINELKNLGYYLQMSVNTHPPSLPCKSFYDYACTKGKHPYPSIGQKLSNGAVKNLFDEIKSNGQNFSAKTKLINFFESCEKYKNIDNCYEEVLKYFKLILGYAALKFNSNSYDQYLHNTSSIRMINKFQDRQFRYLKNKDKLEDQFRLIEESKYKINPEYLDREYEKFIIDPNSYHQNILNMEQNKNSSRSDQYVDLIDYLIYTFQTHNKPLIYFYPTLNIHLWSFLFEEIYSNHTKLNEILDCVRLEGLDLSKKFRKMAAVFYSGIKITIKHYNDWLEENPLHKIIDDTENKVLKPYRMSTKRIYFIILAQTFCKYGKNILDNSILQGYRHSADFKKSFKCDGPSAMNPTDKCDL